MRREIQKQRRRHKKYLAGLTWIGMWEPSPWFLNFPTSTHCLSPCHRNWYAVHRLSFFALQSTPSLHRPACLFWRLYLLPHTFCLSHLFRASLTLIHLSPVTASKVRTTSSLLLSSSLLHKQRDKFLAFPFGKLLQQGDGGGGEVSIECLGMQKDSSP